MKRIALFIILGLALTGCVKKPNPVPDPIITNRLTTTEVFTVPIKDGYTTIVKLGSDTLCVATESTSILIPKNTSVVTKAGGIDISYIEGTDPDAGTSQIWQSVGFEDSEVGDYDYNDLVIHCKYEIKTLSNTYHRLGIGVHPIALGSTKTIALGCKVYINDVLLKDEMLSNDCRKDLFGSQENMINTGFTANFHTNFFKDTISFNIGETKNLSEVKVVWFIKVGNKYFYAVNDKYEYLDAANRPYGIIVTNTGKTYYQDERNPEVGANWFPYPYESVNINQLYTGFDAWIDGRAQFCDMSSPVEGKGIDPGTYTYNRPKEGPTRIYYFPSGRNVF